MLPRIEMPRALLLACAPFAARLDGERVAAALAAGLLAGGAPHPDAIALPGCPEGAGAAGLQDLLADEGFDARMRAARALVIAVPRLAEQTLAGSLPFELATRARQSGVPCYAVARESLLSSFDERILDLQAVIEAAGPSALRRAGRKLAEIA
ncbi:MAG: hypothetical protein ACYDC2_02140 [Solirubrobacteraceae bacterium]